MSDEIILSLTPDYITEKAHHFTILWALIRSERLLRMKFIYP